MIRVHYKENGDPKIYVNFSVKNKLLNCEVTYKKDNEDVVFQPPTKDLSNIENNMYVLLGDGKEVYLLDGYRFTESYRDRLMYLKKMLNTEILLIVKIGKKTSDSKEVNIQVEANFIPKENLTIETDNEIGESLTYTFKEDRAEKKVRRGIFPCYALVLNGQEYHADDEGTPLNDTYPTITYSGDTIDLCVKKYDYGFNNVMNEADDTDKVYIETTCGIINARMTYLENGEKHLIFNPLGYEGAFTIKIGWRWNPVVNQYNLILKKEVTNA